MQIEQVIYRVDGCEAGPVVRQIILQISSDIVDIKHIDYHALYVETAGVSRMATGVYLCDAIGNRKEEFGGYISIELAVERSKDHGSILGSPFGYDEAALHSIWLKEYKIRISGLSVSVADGIYLLEGEYIGERFSLDAERFIKRYRFQGEYENPLSKKKEMVSFSVGSYIPPSMGGIKKPLLIWLHGQGEGGTDVDIVTLGNQVTALTKEEIQGYFISEGEIGAYVAVFQCETYWMDEGDGTNGNGSGYSRYTKALKDALEDYLSKNPYIDTDRIYLGGCSNGGYMTLHMLLEYPEIFAGAFVNCPAYAYWEYEKNEDGSYKEINQNIGTSRYQKSERIWFTEEKAKILKDKPIWFINAANDDIVMPADYSLPIYKKLLEVGAEDIYYSYFESVQATDIPGEEYIGHLVWIYMFHNQVMKVQDRKRIREAGYHGNLGFCPSNAGGGSEFVKDKKGNPYESMFAWLADQRNTSKL